MFFRRSTACIVAVLALSLTAETGAHASGNGNASITGPKYVSAGSTATWSKRCKNGTHTAAWWEGFAWSGYEFLKQRPSFQRERFFDVQLKPGEVPGITLICDDSSRITYDVAIVSTPTLTVDPASVYQGAQFQAKIFCPAPVTVPVLRSSLWGHPDRAGEAGSLYYTAT